MNRRMRRSMAALAMLALLANCAVQAHAQTRARISLRGPGPFHQLELPLAIHGLAAFDDLRDLRVRNASGEVVPWGWLDDLRTTDTETMTTVHAALFALSQASTDRGESGLRIRSRPDGVLALEAIEPAPTVPTQVPARGDADEWVIDTGEVEGERVRARFDLAPGPNGLFQFTLDASDDLRRWRSIDVDGQMARLRQGSARIEQASVELGPLEARFLRLRWKHPEHAPRLTAASIDVAKRTMAPLAWTVAVGPSACGFDTCDYPVPRGLPVRSLRVVLNQLNTLAPLRIFDVDRPTESGASDASRPGRRLLSALHHGHRHARGEGVPDTPVDQGAATRVERRTTEEILLAEATVFRLGRPSGETHSGAIALDGRPHTVLRLRTQGAIAALGAVPPTLSYGTRPSTLVFLAQGSPPFTLSWNRDRGIALPMPDALPVQQLIPGRQGGQPPRIDLADVTFEVPANASSNAVPSHATPNGAAPTVITPAETAATRPVGSFAKSYLWGALVIIVLLLAAMVWSLLRAIR